MLLTEIKFGSPAYDASVALRDEVLRKPLQLQFTIDQLSVEWEQYHLAAYDKAYQMQATLSLSPVSRNTIKMRQVAVQPRMQGRGIGRVLVEFCERFCQGKGFQKITLHARDVAVPFYEKLGYKKTGQPFEEVGIRHFKMEKRLPA